MHVRTARKQLELFPIYDKNIFMNVAVDDESWIHYFELHQKISNLVWLTQIQEGIVLPQGLPVRKKVIYAILYTTRGLAIQVPIPEGKSMNARFYQKKL